MKQEQELLTYVKAKYPLVYITSPEERRVEAGVLAVAKALDMGLRVWTLTTGFSDVDGMDVEACPDPSQALSTIANNNGRCIYILKDFHPFLDAANTTNVPVIRLVRDLAKQLKSNKRENVKCVLFLSSRLVLPEELQSEVAVLNWKRPDEQELLAALEEIASSLSEELRANLPADLMPIAQAAKGLTLDGAQNCFAKSLVQTRGLDASLIAREKKQLIEKDGVLELMTPEGGLEIVGGLDSLKGWCVKRQLAFSAKARAYGLPEPKGVILFGIPGTGKSLAAKAVAQTWGLPLIRLDFGKLFGSLLGESEGKLRMALSIIETVSPCVVLADEVDKGLGGMENSSGDSGTSSRIFGSFLTWMQEKKAPVFVVMTLNKIDGLPPELFRKGRTDELFFVDLPNSLERQAIFMVHLKKRMRDPDLFDLVKLAASTQGFSGAEIEAVVIEGLFNAFADDREIEMKDILAAIGSTVPLSKSAREKIDAMRRWAEGRAKLASIPEAEQATSRFGGIEV